MDKQLRLNLRIIYLFCIAGLFACNPPLPPNEAVRNYSNFENFLLYNNSVDVEFVHDSTEYIKFIGNFNSDPMTNFMLIENDPAYFIPNAPMLGIKGYNYPGHVELKKIEIHYINLRRIVYYTTPPINLANQYPHYNFYSREPIVADSIDIFLLPLQDSVLDVNTSVLSITGGIIQSKIAGQANKLLTNFQAIGPSEPIRYNYGELITDSCFLHITNPFAAATYARADVYANDYLDISVQDVIGLPSDCPTCLFEIYYKGFPTIHNVDSLDSRIVVIDNN